MEERFVRTGDGRIIFQAIASVAASNNHIFAARMHGYADNGFPDHSPIQTNDTNIWSAFRTPAHTK